MKSFRYGEIIIGACLGIIAMYAIYFFVLHGKIKDADLTEQNYPLQTATKIDSVQVGNYNIHIKERNEVQIKEHDQVVDEKIKSLNDRLGDIYLSFGIIIALLLAIVAGVYFKTEAEVAKHMNKNYGKYKEDFESMLADCKTILDRMRSNEQLSEQILSKAGTNQQIQGA